MDALAGAAKWLAAAPEQHQVERSRYSAWWHWRVASADVGSLVAIKCRRAVSACRVKPKGMTCPQEKT
jgi:hypothetical protein